MKELKYQLRQLRPKLKDIAPLTHAIVWAFFWFNLWIGLTVLLQKSTNLSKLIIIHSPTGQYMWAGIFFLLGTSLLVGLLRNSWTLIKWTMVLGVTIKSIWLYAIIYLGYKTNLEGTMGTIGLWFFAAWVQVLAVAYFLPGTTKNRPKRFR